MPILPLILACARPVGQEPPVPQRWSVIALGERPVGVGWSARRVERGREVLWRGERYLWRLDGVEHRVQTDWRAELAGEGRVRSLRARRNGEVQGAWQGEPAWWLDAAAAEGRLPTGRLRAIDPARWEVVEVEVGGEGEGRAWSLGPVDAVVEPGPQGPVLRWGALSRRPVAAEPALRPVDPVALVRRPASPVPRARASRWARWRVDGVERVVEVPLDAEIPADRLATLRELVDGVRADLRYVPLPGSPDAWAALRQGRGDCAAHAALFVERARARGLEARPVAGVVYTEARGPGLDLHAWAEVRLGTRGWVPVDPTLGQPVADATHLPLAEGAAVARALGRLSAGMGLELVEVR